MRRRKEDVPMREVITALALGATDAKGHSEAIMVKDEMRAYDDSGGARPRRTQEGRTAIFLGFGALVVT